jgi:hypothetical protein
MARPVVVRTFLISVILLLLAVGIPYLYVYMAGLQIRQHVIALETEYVPDFADFDSAFHFKELMKIGSPAVPQLLPLLESDRLLLRGKAVRLLSAIDDEHGMADDEKDQFSRLLEQTFYDLPEYTIDDGAYTQQRVRSFYFRALALNTDRPYRPFAVQALTDPDLRVEAIHLLGEKGAWEEVEQTVADMLEDPEPGNRDTAVELLRYAPTRAGMKMLIDQLDDRDEDVRNHCLTRLGEMATSMMLSESLQKAVTDTPESIQRWKVWRDENLR